MDDYMFNHFVNECLEVSEETSYVEILNYSDSTCNTCEEHALSLDEFDNFLHRQGAFAPPERTNLGGTELLSGLRLVVQMNANNSDTFTPQVISLPKKQYESMVRVLRLPLKGIETTAVVGPFFWSALDQNDQDPYLQIIYRKSDVRKKGKTRGWEMMLSHSVKTHITTGYIKGTESSDVEIVLKDIQACTAQISHPMLLPVILFSHSLSPACDEKQRNARDWVRKVEKTVTARDDVLDSEGYFQDGKLDLDGLSNSLVETHGQVMWKRPQAYIALAMEMEKGMETFKRELTAMDERSLSQVEEGQRKTTEKLHGSMLARLDFYKVKLTGQESYIHTTLERIKVQREALYNIMSQREAKLNLKLAGEQRRIAHASKRDGTAVKTLALMGALFLPGTYLSSVFSMSFFNFEPSTNSVSKHLWIYFAVAVPVTIIVVVSWYWFERRREEMHQKKDADLENDDKAEQDIIFELRKRTTSRSYTWNTGI